MANTRISDLTASASNLASTDLAPVVQTVGVGPVKMTGAQIAAGLLSATTPIGSGPILSRGGSATLQLGAADAAAPVAQTFKVQSVAAGTSNTAGANFTIQGSQGTGTGAGGSIIFQVAPAGGSSNGVQNGYSTALTINSDKSSTIDGNIRLGKPGAVSNYGLWFGTTAVGSPSDTNYTFVWNSGFTILNATGGSLYLRVGNTDYMTFGSDIVTVAKLAIFNSDAYLRTNAAKLVFGSSDDVVLNRDAANTLALKNSTNPQIFRAYSTTTGPSYGYFASGVTDAGVATADTLFIGTGGAGAAMTKLALVTNGVTQGDFNSTFTNGCWSFATGVGVNSPSSTYLGNFTSLKVKGKSNGTCVYLQPFSSADAATLVFSNDAGTTFEAGIFRAGSTFPVTAYRNNLVIYTNSNPIYFSTDNGAGTLNPLIVTTNASGMVAFMGLTSSFPALKRSSTTLQVRLADDTAFAPLACSSFSQTAGTLADGANAYSLTATMPASPTGTMTGVSYTVTSAGSASQQQLAAALTLAAGYTGGSATTGLVVTNSTTGTAGGYAVAGNGSSYRVIGNRGINSIVGGSTAGINVGVASNALGSATANYGVWGSATFASNNAWNVGVAGFGLNTGTGTQEVGGFFALYDGGTSAPNLISAALVADNGTSSNPIFLARDNASTVFTIANGGAVTTTSSIQTGAPTGGTAGAWKFGSRVAATTVLDTTQYIELDIGGTLYKLAVVTS